MTGSVHPYRRENGHQPGLEVGGLAAIGLSAAEEAAYELLVDRSPATAAELAECWQRPEPLVEVLASLEAKELASRVSGNIEHYTAQPPDVAFDALLLAEEEQVRAARTHIDELAATYAGRGSATDLPLIERLVGAKSIERRLAALCRSARTELRWLASPVGCKNIPEATAVVLRLRERGVPCRGLYNLDTAAAPAVRSMIEQVNAAGAEARICTDLPTVLYLIDNRIAVLPLEWDGQDMATAMVVHPSGLRDALDALFEILWKKFTPPGWATTGGLIELLLSGGTDAAIARQLGVGYRTVVRRVAELMDELGAHTRFQAGVQAALRDAELHSDR